jgi:hypothetical protein
MTRLDLWKKRISEQQSSGLIDASLSIFYCMIFTEFLSSDQKCTKSSLDLTKPPFCIKGSKVLQWRCDDHGVIKACYLFKNF